MPPKIDRCELWELAVGMQADFFAMLCKKETASTKDGKQFFKIEFRDRQRRVPAVPVWSDSPLFDPCSQTWVLGDHFKVRAKLTQNDKFGMQLEILNIRPVSTDDWSDGYNPDALVPCTKFEIAKLYAELCEFIASISNQPLRQLVEKVVTDHKEAVKTMPAAARNHHAFRGGYLEHTVSVVKNGIYLAEKYIDYYSSLIPPLSRDLVVAGCVLHDIGKVHELTTQNCETVYSPAGLLIGHILIGRDMVRDAARSIPELHPEVLLCLEHIIISHQGTPEWGSPKIPMMPEALLVHYADDIDAKMNMFVNVMEACEGEDPFTEQKNALQRRILRKRSF